MLGEGKLRPFDLKNYEKLPEIKLNYTSKGLFAYDKRPFNQSNLVIKKRDDDPALTTLAMNKEHDLFK